MRTRLGVFVLVVALGALALLVSATAARPGPPRPLLTTPPYTATPTLVPKTQATLPGGMYPWVQPVWTQVDGITVVTLPPTTPAGVTQPPAWIFDR